MSTITKQAMQAVADLKAGYTLGHADVAILNELARIALASLEAEAVCVIDQSNLDYLKSGSDADVWPASRTEMGDVLLYRAAPSAPVSVPDFSALDKLAGEMLTHAMNCERRVAVAYTHCAHRLAEEVRDLRAAMLQGAEPVSNRDELPMDYLQGHKDGLEWAAQMAEANHPQTGDWLYDDPVELAKAIRKGPDMPEADGNSPVIPDGWKLLPVEPTPEMQSAAAGAIRFDTTPINKLWTGNAVYRAMLAAAPQQEVKS